MSAGGGDLRSVIAREIAAGRTEDELVSLLQSRGLSEANAKRFAAKGLAEARSGAMAAPAPRAAAAPPVVPDETPDAEDASDGTWRLTFGVLFLVGGLAFTALTYLLARPGGKFTLLWGAVAYGFIDVCRGLGAWWQVRERVAFPFVRVAAAALVPLLGAGALLVGSPRGRASLAEADKDATAEELARVIEEYRRKHPESRRAAPETGRAAPAATAAPGADDSPSGLTAGLQAPDAFARRTAAQRIGLLEQEASGAIPALLTALGDSDPQVRAAVLYALGKVDVSGTRSSPFVAQRLADDDAEVRVEAGRALCRMGLKSGLDALVKELRGTDPKARVLAASALETVDTARAVEALTYCVTNDPSPRARASCILALRRAGPAAAAALPALAKARLDPDPDVQKWATMVYGQLEPYAATGAR